MRNLKKEKMKKKRQKQKIKKIKNSDKNEHPRAPYNLIQFYYKKG